MKIADSKSPKKDTAFVVVVGVLLIGVLVVCGWSMTRMVTDGLYVDKHERRQSQCLVHLHQAGKAMYVEESESQLDISLVCLPEIRDICVDEDFDDKIIRIEQLRNDVRSARKLSRPDQEIMLQKVNRILFNGGSACYKGQCQNEKSNSTPFICNQIKDPR